MKEGSVVRIALQQHDGKFVKRPAVLIKKHSRYDDCIVCGISKSIGLAASSVDIVVTEKDEDFKTWGLDYSGVIRTCFLFTISSKHIEGTIGNLTQRTHRQIINNLVRFLSS